MNQDAFSRCHPAVNFLYFVGAIGFGVVIQHPAYMLAAVLGALLYYVLLKGRDAFKMTLLLLPVFLLIALINPLFNTLGKTELFLLFGKPYTLVSQTVSSPGSRRRKTLSQQSSGRRSLLIISKGGKTKCRMI